MNREVARALRAFRKKDGRTAEELADALGWTPRFYIQAELGAVALSAGQQYDMLRVMAAAVKAAGIRDQLRAKGPQRIRRL